MTPKTETLQKEKGKQEKAEKRNYVIFLLTGRRKAKWGGKEKKEKKRTEKL